MKPVSIAWSSAPGSGTVTVWVWPPIRAAASYTVISWPRWRWWAATRPEMPVPTIAIFTVSTTDRRLDRMTGGHGIAAVDRSAVGPVEQLVAEQLADRLEAVAAA